MAVITKGTAIMEFPLVISRQYGASLERFEVFYSLEEAKTYAKTNPLAYVGQTIKVVNEVENTVQVYTIKDKAGNFLQGGSAEHTHSVDDIITTEEKQFISKAEKDKLADTYRKSEVDKKIADLSGGLEFKGVFETLDALNKTVTEPKDGYFAIITNDPAGKGKNFMVIYEASEPAGWKQLGELLVPGEATESSAGLMSAAMVKALNKAGVDIEGLKDGSLLPKASTTQVGVVKQGANITIAADGTISTHNAYVHPETHPATIIVQDSDHKFVSDAQIAGFNDKYTKDEADQAIATAVSGAKTELTSEYKAADGALETKITAAYQEADKTIDSKVTAMDSAYKSADTAINKRIDNLDTAYKEADTAITGRVEAAESSITNLQSDLEAVQNAISPDGVASDADIESIF